DVKYRIRRPDGSFRWIHDKGTPVFDETGKVVRVVGIASDITEQVEVERRVNESEVRFRQIAETIPEVFWIFDTTQQQLLYISPAYETIFGQSVQELYADSRLYIKSIHPKDRSIMFAALRRQAHGEEIEIRYRIIRPDGLMRWIHFRSFPIFDETTGKLARTAGIAADITENKLADQALRDSEERLRLSLAASRQGLYDLNIQSGETIVNHEYVEMLGYAPETFVETHQKWIERLHPEDKQAVAKTYSNYIQGIAPEFHVEFRQKTKDGKWKWILSIGKVVEYDANGNPLRLLGTHTDIDALKQAEMELQKRASQLTLINDMAGEITGVLDIQGVLELSARLVHASFGYHHVGLFTMNEAKNEMVMRSRAGKYAHLFPSQHRVKLGEGIVGNVGRRGEMILTNQVGENPVYKNYFPALLDTVSELGLPIKIAGQVIGVLDVQSPQPNAFNSDDIQVLQTLADQVAIALENARLYESVQKELIERKQAEKERQVLIHDLGERVKELTALHQAARLFQNLNLSEKEIMQSLVEILPQAWQYPKFTVARISVGREEYTTPSFIETQWLQKASFTLPDDRTGAIEVVYLKECPLEDEGPFLKEERALIDTLAERLQSSMARQFMEHSLRKRTEDLANLVEAGRTLSESLDPQRIYPLVYRYIANVVPCDFITVSSHDPSTGRIKYEYWHTTEGAQDISDMFFEPLENSIQSRVIRNGESLLLPDYESALKTAANNMNLDEMVEEESEGRARSAIIVPLKVNGVTAGVLQVSSLKLNTHTQDHLRFIEALAFHVSAALSNALLFSELEERVRQRTAEVQDLYDNAPTGYHSLDEEGRYIAVNQTEMSWLGYTREELIGHPFMEFATPENRQMFSNNFALFKKRGWVSDLELDLIRQDGSTFPVLINATVVRDEAGNYLSSRSTMFDNTERKKAEITLRESEEQSRLLFEESPEAVVLFDQAGRVVRMNRAFETVTGLKSEEFIGHLVTEIGILPRDLMDALASQTADEVEAGDRFARLEFKLKHANSEPRDISARIFVVNLHGRLHYLASMHDITIRKRAEETLRLANAEMERALRLKDEFLANMSHELRTPLNAILGITESLLEQVSGALNDKQQKYLQTVLESAQHLLELINDILDLAKINAGRIGLDVSKVNIQSIAQSSLRMIRELAQKKGLDVKLEIDQAVKTVWADERRLRQMLVNLLSNAVKFTPTGGKIGLDIRADQSGEILTFTVWDSGIGINENDMRLLFQPFVQLDAGLARGSQGTGLGLVLVSQMARLHGGSVSVESEPEKGSRFIIAIPWKEAIQTAPLAESRLPEATVEPSAVVQNDRASILIVEDTEAVIMLVSDYLKLHGFHVITAKDGYEGLTRAEETHPDLILMDVMMPEMDGLETTRRIRNQLGMKDVPIIALTALAMAGDRERCLAAGMSDYLSKPVKLKELLTAIEKNLDSTKGGSQ
ncbi:MAG: PAS domain S-box protein, partial [Chloroflexi bacterium]|nr:PAS domain S-box protein [Chloroflexota bacterium]